MRRWTTFHDRAAPLVAYLARDGHALAGSVPAWTPAALRAALQPYERPRGRGLLHITLSLPRGRTLSDAGWHDVADHVLARTGLPPDLVAWIAWGRETSACDHIHIVVARETVTRRPLTIATSKLDDRPARARPRPPARPPRPVLDAGAAHAPRRADAQDCEQEPRDGVLRRCGEPRPPHPPARHDRRSQRRHRHHRRRLDDRALDLRPRPPRPPPPRHRRHHQPPPRRPRLLVRRAPAPPRARRAPTAGPRRPRAPAALAGLIPLDAVPALPRYTVPYSETDHARHDPDISPAARGPLDADGPAPRRRPGASSPCWTCWTQRRATRRQCSRAGCWTC